jgi:AcrR family transcriptional regulator
MPKAPSIKSQANEFKWNAVVDTAIDLFYANGYQGTSVDMIADALGVTKPFIYYRFGSKAELLIGIFEQIEERVIAESMNIFKSSAPVDVKFAQVVQQLATSAIQNWKLVAVFYNEERDLPEKNLAKVHRLRKQWEQGFCSLLDEGRAAGVFRYGDVRVTVKAILGAILWTHNWWPEFAERGTEGVINELARCALAIVDCRAPFDGNAVAPSEAATQRQISSTRAKIA